MLGWDLYLIMAQAKPETDQYEVWDLFLAEFSLLTLLVPVHTVIWMRDIWRNSYLLAYTKLKNINPMFYWIELYRFEMMWWEDILGLLIKCNCLTAIILQP